MIVVMFAPKGGTGKTTLTYHLSKLLPTGTRFLDLADNNDLSKKLVLDQPKPNRITKDYLNALLPKFYDEGLLIIDCGGYASSLVLECMAKSDKIIFPIKQGMTNKDKPEILNNTLVQLSDQLDFDFKAITVWNDIHPSTKLEPLNSSLSDYKHLQPVPFKIRSNVALRDGLAITNAAAKAELDMLVEVILE